MSYIKGRQKFINPYNFIPVDWEGKYGIDIVDDIKNGKNTGVLHCSLVTKTPIALPDMESAQPDVNIEGHVYYEFMRDVVGNPYIPGSSLRGVFRSVYEAVTDSCFVTSRVDELFSKRAGMRESGKPYLLKKDEKGWYLIEAERSLITMSDPEYAPFPKYPNKIERQRSDLKYGAKVYFSTDPTPYKIWVGKVVTGIGEHKTDVMTNEGYIYKGEIPPKKDGERPAKKHFESIFSEKKGGSRIKITNSQKETLVTIYESYNDKGINHNLSKGISSCYDGFLEALEKAENDPNAAVPVWYNERNKKLSLAAIGRIVYDKKMGDLISEKKPCSEREHLCKACALFGMANGQGKVGSRVRISDATIIPEDSEKWQKGKSTLKELGSPRKSYIPFYTENEKNNKQWDYDTDGTKLKGRKVYWHNSVGKAYEVPDGLTCRGKTGRNATMEILDKDITFDFDVYFEKISDEQLKELKWILTFGENCENGRYCHKIGHGKPIGLGSVKVYIREQSIRSYDTEKLYSIASTNIEKIDVKVPDSINIKNNKQYKDILDIADFEKTKNVTVAYPMIDGARENDNKTAAHQWFTNNWMPKVNNNPVYQEWRNIEEAVDKPFYSLKYVRETDAGGRRRFNNSNNANTRHRN